MSQHDFEILTADANTGTTVRAAINAAIQALASLSTGATAPTTTYPNQLWYDTANSVLKKRNNANSAWENFKAPEAIAADSSTNADTVDTFHATKTPTAERIPVTPSGSTHLAKGWLRPKLLVVEVKAPLTDGGDLNAGTNNRVLNTVLFNDITGASLASNKVTLPAGTYRVHASCPAYNILRHQAFVYNYTDAVALIAGTSEYSKDSAVAQTRSFVAGEFTIAGTKEVGLLHWAEQTQASSGAGIGSSYSSAQFSVLEIEQVA